MNNLLEQLVQGKSLGPDDTRRLFAGLIGDTAPEVKAAVLTALRVKGETETEIAALAEEMRRHAVALPHDLQDALDTCGTGGDGLRTINLSTLAALVLSSMGVPIVKHGNRSVSSSCGSADVLEGLGLPLDLSVDQTAALFRKTGFAFLFAPLYHPAMKSVAPIRKALKIRTIFNFLGPLSNPAKVRYQVLGVPADERIRPFAEVLKRLGLTSALVVHGEPGMDEVSPCGPTRVAFFLNGGAIQETTWMPDAFGVTPVGLDKLAVSNIQEAVERAKTILAGRGNVAESTAVALNTAAGLFAHGRTSDLRDAAKRALDHVSSGAAMKHLESIVQTAQQLKHDTRSS